MSTSDILMLVSIALYLILMLVIGLIYSKKNQSADDFYLGGRKLGPLVTAMSAEASDMSSWLLMGLPGLAYLTGVADASWTAIGLAVGTYVNWLIVAKRIRCYSVVADNSITVPSFFSNRYKDKSGALTLISALVIVIFFVPYTASGFAACGKLFSSLFGLDYIWAMLISAVVIVAYTALGGFLAASTTDLIQSIVMTVALIVVLGFGFVHAGGWNAVWENAKSLPGFLSFTQTHVVETNSAAPYGFINIISMMAWGLGYFGMPHILLRFMAIKDKSKLRTSRRIASIWVVISLAVAVVIGIVGLGMTKAGAIETLEGSNSETLIVKISALIASAGPLMAIVAGIILAGILAATMSTADSQLLAASSSVSQNIIQEVFKIKISQKAEMIIARLTLVGVSIVAAFIARDPNSNVFNIVSFAWAGFGAAFGPVVLTALFWKRSNKWGALAGMASGAAMVFIWKYLVRPLGGMWNIYELLPAFIVATVAIIVVSLLTKAPEKEIIDEFNKAKELSKQ